MSKNIPKIALITGASSGIGLACAQKFAQNGTNLILIARNKKKLEKINANLVEKYNIKTLILVVDVRKQKDLKEIFTNLPNNWKKIDILINNAGLALGLDLIDEGYEQDWDTMIDTNIKGVLYVLKMVVKEMKKRKIHGHIVNIGSIAGLQAYPRGAVYCATKVAVRYISNALREELVDSPIKVTNIQPGLVETNFSNIRFKGDTKTEKNIYKGIDALTGTDIANVIYFICDTPLRVQISELTIMPTQQASVGCIHRHKHKK